MKLVHAILALMVGAALISALPSFGQVTNKASTAAGDKKPSSPVLVPLGSPAPEMSKAQKIALAMSAGPAAISKNATIVDMTDMSHMTQLGAGTNGCVCSASPVYPMCLDKEWQKWMETWMNKSDLKIDATGIGYMLLGDKGASNTDPYAKGPTADGQWWSIRLM